MLGKCQLMSDIFLLEGKKNRKLIRNGLKSISSTVLKNGKDLVLFRRSRSPCDFRRKISFASGILFLI